MMNGCGNDKIERKAWLDIQFFDKYGNEIFEGLPIINFYGKKTVTSFFEFDNNENSRKQCSRRIKHIIENQDDRFRISMAAYDQIYRERGADEELRSFRSIDSMKFKCVVERIEPKEIGDVDCVMSFVEKFERKNKPPNFDKLTKRQQEEILARSAVEGLMWTDGLNGFGFCQYDVLDKKSETYFIKDILAR
jgi:hypothetical protein